MLYSLLWHRSQASSESRLLPAACCMPNYPENEVYPNTNGVDFCPSQDPSCCPAPPPYPVPPRPITLPRPRPRSAAHLLTIGTTTNPFCGREGEEHHSLYTSLGLFDASEEPGKSLISLLTYSRSKIETMYKQIWGDINDIREEILRNKFG